LTGAAGVIEGGFVDPELAGAIVFPEGIGAVLVVGIDILPDDLSSGIDEVAGPGTKPEAEDGV
jgi:hypothetical protein